MGVLKFRLSPPDLPGRFPELGRAYITGPDRTPARMTIELRPGLMLCHREAAESGRLHVPWPVEGAGAPVVATATLAERAEPYDLAVELARGKLNDVRNQVADWTQLGLRAPKDLEDRLAEAQHRFSRAATTQDRPEETAEAARRSLAASFAAAKLLAEAYTEQVLQNRLGYAPKLPTWLGIALGSSPRNTPLDKALAETFNAARIGCTWRQLAPEGGTVRWEAFDAQLAWCRRRHLIPMAGPILEFRTEALPDGLWLWEGDYEAIEAQVLDVVAQAVARARGKVPAWTIAHRVASAEILGLGEEDQIRLTARALQVARQADPNAQLLIGFDRPWAEWMASSPFQLGPLHLADSLVRADLGLAGIGLEIAPGYGPPGSHLRDLMEFSRLLDLYALLNLPLHVTLVAPSAAGPDPQAAPGISVEPSQWPASPDESSQREWASRWTALAVAKPFVRSVTWLHAADATPHLYPHGGLLRPDGTPKPALTWLKSFRRKFLA